VFFPFLLRLLGLSEKVLVSPDAGCRQDGDDDQGKQRLSHDCFS
jgi:hypothetical protein